MDEETTSRCRGSSAAKCAFSEVLPHHDEREKEKTRLLTSRVTKARTVSLNFQTLLFLSYCGAFLASELVTCTCSNA